MKHRMSRDNMDNSQMHEFLVNFWDWMHHKWIYASHIDGCASSRECDDSFKEYVDKFLDQYKERGFIPETENEHG